MAAIMRIHTYVTGGCQSVIYTVDFGVNIVFRTEELIGIITLFKLN